MESINLHQSYVTPLDRVNVDTDQIIPKQFLKRIERTGFGEFLFFGWRFHDDGSKNKSFVLNNPLYDGSSILVTNHNFGCGSSREHAPWALLDYGFKVIIAPSFADIFYNNCVKNGILPICLEQNKVQQLLNNSSDKKYSIKINLEKQQVIDQDKNFHNFDIDPYWKQMLLNGWDEIALTIQYEKYIDQYEKQKN